MFAAYTPPFAPGTRVTVAVRTHPEWGDCSPRTIVHGTATGEPLQPHDTRAAVRIDSGAVILYPIADITPAADPDQPSGEQPVRALHLHHLADEGPRRIRLEQHADGRAVLASIIDTGNGGWESEAEAIDPGEAFTTAAEELAFRAKEGLPAWDRDIEPWSMVADL